MTLFLLKNTVLVWKSPTYGLHSISLGFTSVGDTGIQVLVRRLSWRCLRTRTLTLGYPADTFVVSREGAPSRTKFLARVTSTRTSTLETMPSPLVLVRWLSSSKSSFHLRLLRCAGTVCIVQGVHHLILLIVQVWSLCTVLLGAFVVCICKRHCVCRCTWWSCAGTLHSRFHMLYEHFFQVFRVMYDLQSFAHFCSRSLIFFLFFFFFSPIYDSFGSVVVLTIDSILTIVCMTISVTMNSKWLQGGFYGAVSLMTFLLCLGF